MSEYQQPKTVKFEYFGPHGSVFIVLGLPIAVSLLYLTCNPTGCPVLSKGVIFEQFQSTKWWDLDSWVVFFSWIVFHCFAAVAAPGKVVEGSILPNGDRLKYRLNGFVSLVATIGILLLLVYKNGLGPLVWIADHYFTLATSAILFSFGLSSLLYLYSFRSDKVILAEGGNSGYPWYDFWIGRELNPRLGSLDLKFICELRPGLIGWGILNAALAAKQYSDFGYVTNSMILVNFGQGYYIFDAIWNERAILTTMDIISDGFGFMLVFGDLAWVPFTYSLQARYLSFTPVELSTISVNFIIILNLFGLFIFRAANSEKNRFRINPDDPKCAHLNYIKTERGTKLLISGWWGMARKINYTGKVG